MVQPTLRLPISNLVSLPRFLHLSNRPRSHGSFRASTGPGGSSPLPEIGLNPVEYARSSCKGYSTLKQVAGLSRLSSNRVWTLHVFPASSSRAFLFWTSPCEKNRNRLSLNHTKLIWNPHCYRKT